MLVLFVRLLLADKKGPAGTLEEMKHHDDDGQHYRSLDRDKVPASRTALEDDREVSNHFPHGGFDSH